jgi:hypothetical protein
MNSWHQDFTAPPWRRLTNEERRAAWAAKYYIRYKPYTHPTKGESDAKGIPISSSQYLNRS